MIQTKQRTLRYTASGNKTNGAQIAELKTVFDALTDEEKKNAILIDSTNQVFNLVSMLGVFSYVTAYASGVVVYTINMYSGKRYNANNNSVTDATSSTNSASVSLYA